MGPSRTRRWAGIVNDDWKQIGFGDGMYWQLDPSEPRYAYGNAQNGSYTRVDTETGDILDIAPAPPPGEDEYRWDWVSPSLVSVHDPSTVYVGGNRLFISRDRGVSWERTEDLTRAIDRDNLELMGVKGADMTLSPNDGTSSFGEITTIAESPLDARILWVGTDDGNLQVSRDGGRSWTPVHGTVGGVADGTYVWRSLAATLPSGSANSLVEHPDNPSVLFLGTEHHLFASTDAGVTWAQMPTLPTTHYDDLVVHPRDRDLVIGTHGRGIWILDDVVPLARWSRSVAEAAAHLFPVRPATLFHYWKDTSYRGNAEFAGENPVDGAIVTYSLGAGAGDARITVAAADGMVVREMTVPDEATIHRINWDLRHGLPDAELQWAPHEDPRLARSTDERGPFVTPGTYTISLEARGTTVTETVEVLADPELPVTLAQYREREAFLLRVLALQSQASTARLAMAGLAGGPELEQLEEVDDILEQVYEEIDGSGVRPGTLYPPTDTQRQRVDAAEATLAELAPDIPEP
jgi:hypothetical protein